MFGQNKWLWDVLGGVGLFLALLVVFLVNRLAGPEKVINTLDVIVVNDPTSNPAFKKMRMAVTGAEAWQNGPALWDDMGKLLDELGAGYQYTKLTTTRIQQNPDILDNYDVLFLTCAPNTGPDLKDILVRFVTRGGMLYASDWRYDAVAAAFPELVAPNFRGDGTAGQSVQAEVVDPNLRELIGPSINLFFDLGSWKTAAFAGPRVTTLLQGNYRKEKFPGDPRGQAAFAPLMVRFSVGQGSVIFTSFHNEKQRKGQEVSETEKKLLQYLVFHMVMADVESAVHNQAEKEGFAAQKSNLLSTPEGQPTVTKQYQHNSGKPLRFVLGFRNEGAKLTLKITSPEKKVYQKEVTSLVILDVPDAPKGEWTYEVTAVDLPYPNFPFSLTVAEKK
jgi:hypothetical protein